jgi:hypothetical protein
MCYCNWMRFFIFITVSPYWRKYFCKYLYFPKCYVSIHYVSLVSTLYVALKLSTLSRLFMLPWCCQPCLDTLCCLDAVNLISLLNVALILSTLSRYFMLFWFCQPCIDNLCCLDTINLISIVYVVSILSTLFRYFMLYWYSQPCIDTLCCLDTVNCVSILCWCDCCQSWAQNQY